MRANGIAVTGGAGFIGSHLVERIVDWTLGVMPWIMDDLSRGSKDNIPVVYMHQSREDWTIHKYKKCIVDLSKEVPDFSDVSVLFHLAAKVTGIQYNVKHNLEMLQSNLAINLNVIEGIRNWLDFDRIIWVSTACVYPHDAPVPTPEDGTADICDPEPTNRGYGIAKWVGEQQALYLWKELSIPITVVRFFNAFGPRDYYDEETSHVAPALIKRVLDGEDPITVWGTGLQTRALVDARDIAKAVVMLADCEESYGQVVNIGHADEISIEDLALLIMELAYDNGYISHKPELEFDTSKPDGYPRRAADTTKLRRLIGWIPDTPISTTIEDMINDYHARRCDSCHRHPCVCDCSEGCCVA